MNEPVGGRVDRQCLSIGSRGVQAGLPERQIRRLVATRQHAQGDFGAVAEEGLPHRPAA